MASRDNPEFLSADSLKDDKVVNRDGEDLGKFEDLMIDLGEGRIAYAALSFGGFLGMGDKLFAIPWRALTLRAHEHAFVLDIPKETLENAEGFDKDNWPATTRESLSSIYSYYGYQPYWQTGAAAEQTGISTGMRGETESGRITRMRSAASRDNAGFLRADKIQGEKVVNTDGDHIGKIEDIMIDLQDGMIAYAVITHGGILGIGSKQFSIPWHALSLSTRENAFVLDIPKETLDKAEGLDKDKWPVTREELSRTYTYYGYQPYWQAAAVGTAAASAGILGETEVERTAQMKTERKGLAETEEEIKARQERERLEGLRETQEEKVSHLEKEKTERRRQAEAERERLARLEKEQADLERQAKIEREKLTGLEKELQEAIRQEQTEKVSKLEREVKELQGQEQTRRERLAQLQSERERVGMQADTEKERLTRLEKERLEAERRVETEQERLARLERERMEAESKVGAEQEQLTNLERERIETEKLRETEQERLTKLEREKVAAEKWRETEPARVTQMGRTEGMTVREGPEFLSASTIKGDKVINTAGENLGKIEELMIDLNDGRIAYTVLSFGGFLGLGDKLFAIPWNAFSLRVHEHAFVLNVPKDVLEKAEGFDKNNWPLTSREWLSRTYAYYGYQPYWQREVTERTGLPGEIRSERVSSVESTASIEKPEFLSAGTIKGDKVINTAGEDLGKIEELMIDLENGRVGYAVLSFGGFLGMADKLFAIPWQALSLRVHEHAFVLDIPKDVLKNAEGFDKDRWPLTREELNRTYTYYGYKPYWMVVVVEREGVSTGTTREAETGRTTTTETRREEPEIKTAEEKMAEQDKERFARMERTETNPEEKERLERERRIAERREQKYH